MELSFDLDEILVFDGVFSEKQSDTFLKHFLGSEMVWGFLTETIYTPDSMDKNTYESHLFSRIIDSEYWKKFNIHLLSHKISEKIGYRFEYERVKANLLISQQTDKLYNTPHVDADYPHLVIIYYVNSSDSPTFFFKNNSKPWEIEKTVESKKGRFVLFNGKKYHASMHPKKVPYRVVINFVITKFEKI